MDKRRRKITTRATFEWDGEKYVETDSEWFEYDGPMALADGEGDDIGDGDLGDGDTGDGGTPDPMEAVTAQLSEVSKGLGGIVETQKGLMERLQSLEKPKGDEEDDDNSSGKAPELPDLEGISRKEFLGVIIEQAGSAMAGELAKLRKEIGGTKETITKAQLGQELKEVLDKNPEAKHLQTEFKEVISDYPGLRPAKVFNMIKMQYPDKVKQIQEKLKINAEKRAESEGNKKYGGMKPSVGKTPEGTRTAKGQDAADIAWAETMSEFPS